MMKWIIIILCFILGAFLQWLNIQIVIERDRQQQREYERQMKEKQKREILDDTDRMILQEMNNNRK